MSDLAYVEQRNAISESRERCYARIAEVLGCAADDLPHELRRAVMMHGHECYQVALAHEDAERHERTTAPAPKRADAGSYRDVPTRVDRVPLNRRAR